MLHRHPESRVYTVISGVFYNGFGGTFDGSAVVAYPPGTASAPARTRVTYGPG
jgi:hypothetical protein